MEVSGGNGTLSLCAARSGFCLPLIGQRSGGRRTCCRLLDSASALSIRFRAPFTPIFFHRSGITTLPLTREPPLKEVEHLQHPSKPHPSTGLQSECWQFLTLLPNQLIRDIAYVVASPSTFSDSQELPLVSKNMFGEDDSWYIVEDWLKGLDPREVLQYFEGRRYSTRLGDHFAACIEYVLKFSPLVLPDPFFISQQVGGSRIQNEQYFRPLKKAKGDFGSFGLQKGGVMSEVVVKFIENDILIKRFSSYRINHGGRFKAIPDSDIECLMNVFKSSSFDYNAAAELKEVVSPEKCQVDSLSELKYADAVLEGMLVLPELVGSNILSQEIKKWRVFYSINPKNGEGIIGKKTRIHKSTMSTVNGSSSKAEKVTSQDKNSGNHAPLDKALAMDSSVGFPHKTEREGKPGAHRSNKLTNADAQNPLRKSNPRKNVKPINKVGALKNRIQTADSRVTAGECDFLFRVNAQHLVQDSLEYAWAHVHHWEVSMHALLYVGPWEAFGLATPGLSVWHQSGKRVLATNEGLDLDEVRLYTGTLYKFLDTPVWADQVLGLDACFLAPTVGDSWLDRKKEMSSKLRLCGHPNMAAKVSNLFHSSLAAARSCGSTKQRQVEATESRYYKPLLGPDGESYDQCRQDPSIIRVIPRAIIKGYLFYEPNLWYTLCTQRKQGKHRSSSRQTKGDFFTESSKKFSTSCLNANHWMGWWVHACDFAEFAGSYGSEGSRWYIAPRNEWLSPIVITGSETHRCSRIFDLVGLLTMILKVGEEAATMRPQRQRRFMVVEVCWSPQITSSPSSYSFKAEAPPHQQVTAVSSEKKGSWVEVSRGFVVETTWPESRQQLAHGFTFSWSPFLVGWK